MTRPVSALYHRQHHQFRRELQRAISRGCERSSQPPTIFFRADDVGVNSQAFTEMIALFKKYRLPLCLATVPSWLNRKRWSEILNVATPSNQWYWHQHGRLHRNFEIHGKKMEFGDSRNQKTLSEQLRLGRARLEQIQGNMFSPFFTPPWNRVGKNCLEALKELEFLGISRSAGAKPVTLTGLPEIPINIDLHTRKETSPQDSMRKLLQEIEEGLASGCGGIMLHHQRMNRYSLELLDLLLKSFSEQKIPTLHFGDLLAS